MDGYVGDVMVHAIEQLGDTLLPVQCIQIEPAQRTLGELDQPVQIAIKEALGVHGLPIHIFGAEHSEYLARKGDLMQHDRVEARGIDGGISHGEATARRQRSFNVEAAEIQHLFAAVAVH